MTGDVPRVIYEDFNCRINSRDESRFHLPLRWNCDSSRTVDFRILDRGFVVHLIDIMIWAFFLLKNISFYFPLFVDICDFFRQFVVVGSSFFQLSRRGDSASLNSPLFLWGSSQKWTFRDDFRGSLLLNKRSHTYYAEAFVNVFHCSMKITRTRKHGICS